MDTLNNEERVKYQKRKNQDFILSGTQYPELLRSCDNKSLCAISW